jgi:hypothetical protein
VRANETPSVRVSLVPRLYLGTDTAAEPRQSLPSQAEPGTEQCHQLFCLYADSWMLTSEFSSLIAHRSSLITHHSVLF